MANVPPNKSEEALEVFIAAVSQPPNVPTNHAFQMKNLMEATIQDPLVRPHLPTNHAFQMRHLMEAVTQDEMVSYGRVRTGWDEDRRRTWEEFCLSYEMGGDRFKSAVEALMDLKVPGDQALTLREFGGDDWTLKIDMLVGGFEMGDMRAWCNAPACQRWVACALVLARQPDRPVPECMRPKD